MRITRMNQKLLDINQIKNIISIDYKDIIYNGNEAKRQVMPGFLVFYENLKYMFLTIQDSYFEEFVRKIKEVYLEEKDIIEDSILKTKKIKINPLTESILLNGNLDNISDLYNFYYGKESYQESLLFEREKVRLFLTIMIYHLRKTLDVLNKTIGSIELSDGTNGSYYLKTTINNQDTLLPLFFEEVNSKTFNIMIGNILEDSLPLKMIIEFKGNGLVVKIDDIEHQITDLTEYIYKNNKLKYYNKVFFKQKIVHEYEQFLYKSENPLNNIAALDNSEENPLWFKLPWEGYLGFTEKQENIDENGELVNGETDKSFINKRVVYFSYDEKSFYLKELYSKIFTCLNSKDVIFDYLNKTMIGLEKEDNYVIETSFDGPGKTGYYNTYLQNKYFYHIGLSKAKELLDKKDLIPLSKIDGLQEKANLLDLKKLRKKEVK